MQRRLEDGTGHEGQQVVGFFQLGSERELFWQSSAPLWQNTEIIDSCQGCSKGKRQ